MARVPVQGTRISRTYEPGDPELSHKKVRPFRFEGLREISGAHRQIHEEMGLTLPEAILKPGFGRQLGELVQQYTGMDVAFWLDTERVYARNQLRALIPGTTCIVVVGASPREEKILIEVDLYFVYRVIAQLLGTKGAIDVHRPLTEIEQGVFLFLALKSVGLLRSSWAGPDELSFRIEDIRNDIKSTADIVRTDEHWMCYAWKFHFDTDVGTLRALVPVRFARGALPRRPPAQSPVAVEWRRRIRQRLQPYRRTPVDGFIQIGSIELTRRDLGALEAGDIILLEQTQVQLDPNGVPHGKALLRIGLGQRGTLHGQLGLDQERGILFQIEDIVIEQVPESHDPVEAHGDAQNPEDVVAEYEDRSQAEGAAEGYDAAGYDESYAEAGYEGYAGYDEGDDGTPDPDDVYDEDYGLDDEDMGDNEGYDEAGYDQAGYEGYEAGYEGGYEQNAGYEQAGYDPAQGGAQAGEAGGDGGGGAAPAGDDSDNLAEVEPLLGDIPMVVVVELGRVQLTADEVIRLRAGQLIEVGRKPSDLLVDLVVNGRLVAKGKLVEIEGALGVELASLASEADA